MKEKEAATKAGFFLAITVSPSPPRLSPVISRMDLSAAKLPAGHDSHRLVTDVIREPRRLRTALGAGRTMRLTRHASHPVLIGRRLSLTTRCFSSLSAAQPSRSCRRRGCGCRFALCWRSSSRRAAATSLLHARLRTRSPAARRRHSRCAGRNCRTRAAADFVRLSAAAAPQRRAPTDVARPQTMFRCRLEG
jgi:hypothetical protein